MAQKRKRVTIKAFWSDVVAAFWAGFFIAFVLVNALWLIGVSK